MTYAEFVALVADMRQTQKEYFLKRTGDLLSKSKKLEKEVDLAISTFKGEAPSRQKQNNLF